MRGENELISAQCPECKHNHQPRGKTNTLAMVCDSCGLYFTMGNWTDVTAKFKMKGPSPALAIGSRGTIKGVVYEVMGYVVKYVAKYAFSWREYLLFNPILGTAFLSESAGNWNLVHPIRKSLRPQSAEDLSHDGEEFQLYQRFQASVYYARGEFFYDIYSVSKSTTVDEYIAPPYLLSAEWHSESTLWYKGECISPSEIATAFKINKDLLPPKEGRGYTEPFISSFKPKSLVTASIAFVLVIVLVQLLFSNTASNETILSRSYDRKNLKEGQNMFVTESFELKGALKNLEVYVGAPVDNDWFFGSFVLVNETDDTEYEFSKEIEYYHGYADGEGWSEGATAGEAFLSKIPEGKYHINIYPEFSALTSGFGIIVTRDVPSSSNMWWVLVLISIFPAYYFIRRHHIEKTRWSDSDFSPYGE